MYLFCRPGITGAATLVFAHEEEILAEVPQEHVETYTVRVLNPIKAKLDLDYANSATLRSDVRLLLDTAFRLGRRTALDEMPEFAEVSYSAVPAGVSKTQ
jgi:lipopolysaccharide/colanic/teichoic acid biosynthesis glycosyltransferase